MHQESCLLYIHTFLPPAKRSCGKVMFLVVSVCQSVYRRGYYMTTHESVQTYSICSPYIGKLAVDLRLEGLLVFRVILRVIQNYVCGMIAMLLAITDLSNPFEFFLIKSIEFTESVTFVEFLYILV